MDNKKFRSADLLVSIVLIIFGIAVTILSIQLIVTGPGDAIYLSNGLMPLIIGVLITLMSVSVLIHAIKEGGTLAEFKPATVVSALKSREGLSTLFILAWLAVYIWVLLEILPYVFATFIYLWVMFRVYYRKNIVVETIIAIAISLLVTVAFGTLVNVPLP